jgi:Protein of unknown function (DUF1236)
MKLLPLTLAATMLAFSIGAAAAADQSATSKQPSTPPTASVAKDNLSLTTAQEKMAWRDISKRATSQHAPAGFAASVGNTVPNDITLRSIPRPVASELPTLRPYRYALLPNKLLIVNRSDKKIVDVINGRV